MLEAVLYLADVTYTAGHSVALDLQDTVNVDIHVCVGITQEEVQDSLHVLVDHSHHWLSTAQLLKMAYCLLTPDTLVQRNKTAHTVKIITPSVCPKQVPVRVHGLIKTTCMCLKRGRLSIRGFQDIY